MEYRDTQTEVTETHLFEEDLVSLEDASTGQRFANYFIDGLLMRYGIAFATGYVLAQVLLAISPELAYEMFGDESSTGYQVLALYLILIINYLIYYTLCEKAFKGKTLGKLITGTKAVQEDGSALSWKAALLRSLCRMIPFEPLSIWFGSGLWHDTWTKTRVIKSR
jgi:uncharacterized RDD family membrane protein YckC